MKSLLAKTLTSTALVLVTFTVAQAETQPPRIFSPGELQYWEKREAIIAKEVKEEAKGRTRTPLRPAYLPWQPPLFTPAQLQYWDERDAALAKELKNQPMKESAMEWMQRQPHTD